MKTKNLLAALKKAGAVQYGQTGNGFWVRLNCRMVTWFDQDGEALAVRVRNENDVDDILTDYFAGSFAHSIKAAVRWASEGFGLPKKEEAAQ